MMMAEKKRQVFLDLLATGNTVLVMLDATYTGVVVPSAYAAIPQLGLHYGLNTPVPIPDLEARDDGIAATLSFSRVPCATFVPWEAVNAIVAPAGVGEVAEEAPKPKRGRHLRSVS